MSNIIDLLLQSDINKIKNNSKEYEVKRLSKILGSKFIITCRPLTNEQVNHIMETAKTNADVKVLAIYEACRLESKKFNDKELMDKFNVIKPTDLIDKLLLPGEVSAIYEIINTLSGYGKDVVTEIKN